MRSPHVPVAEVRGAPTTHTHASSGPAHVSQHPTPPSPPPVLCDVCCEHVPDTSLRGCAACTHRYCASCVDKYWTGAIYSGNHARLLCMYGGCGVFATDHDVASVVSHRTYRKMLYFRSRDAYNNCPGARWCAVDLCWQHLGVFGPARDSCPSDGPFGVIVSCPACSGKTCTKCDRLVSFSTTVHVCASRKPKKAHTALFSMWALIHTKSCPACAARIQRNHGCSHMTCTRCSSYFCWRCKGFLNNGCPLPGRACICDRVMTAAAYSGLAVAGLVGFPLIAGAVVIAGPPYLAYRVVKARRSRPSRPDASFPRPSHREHIPIRPRHARPPAITILRPDHALHDDDLDSGSTRYTAFSDLLQSEPHSATPPHNMPLRRARLQTRIAELTALGADSFVDDDVDSHHSHDINTSEERSILPLIILQDPHIEQVFTRSASISGVAFQSAPSPTSTYVSAPNTPVSSSSPPSTSTSSTATVDACPARRPFVLERRRGSVGRNRIVRRSVM